MNHRNEFAAGWPVLLAAVIGGGCGISAILAYNFGLFYADLANAIALTRTQFGTAYFAATIGITTSMPLVGALLNRYGLKKVIATSAAMLALVFVCLATLPLTVPLFMLLMFLAGSLGGASTPVGYSRAVSSWFVRRRGMALGITQAGVGLSGFVIPPITAWVIATQGWRNGYLLLAALATFGIPIALLFITTCPHNEQQAQAQHLSGETSFQEVKRLPLFWQLMLSAIFMGLGFGGLMPHFVPLMRLLGASAMEAAGYASLIGIAVLCSRIVVGWLADLIHAPWIGTVTCTLCALAYFGLSTSQLWIAPIAALTLGCALGAEVDLISFLTAKYFGLKAYSEAYAWQYGGFALASGISPIWMGFLADRSGNYQLSLIIGAALLLVSAALMLRLPRYEFGTH